MHDVRDLIGQVAARNSVRVDEDDPLFAFSTINRLMLEENLEQMASRFRAIVQEFEVSARAVDDRAGKFFADEVRRSATAWRDQINDNIKAAGLESKKLVKAVARSYSWPHMVFWSVVGLASGALLFGSGMVVGMRWR